MQNLLEKAQRPYTGSNAEASKLAFDKIAAKDCLSKLGIKVAPHLVIESDDRELKSKLKIFYDTHGSLVVKPVCGGSSIGCLFIKSASDLLAIDSLLRERYLVEKMITGTEITVGVIDYDHHPIGLPGTEIALAIDRDFDYQGKYLGLGTTEITPPRLPDHLMHDAQLLATTAHTALGLDGYSRTDMFLTDDGYYYLETNTLPGLTKQSLIPQQLTLQGISMNEFLRMLIARALRRATGAV